MSSGPVASPRLSDPLDVYLLQPPSEATVVHFSRKKVIFTQGESACCVYYLQAGHVKLTVVTSEGKEGVVALLRDGDFVGEGCVAHDPPVRSTSAITVSDCCLLKIHRDNLLKVFQQDSAFSSRFLSYVIKRSNEMQEHLVDHLFNGAEKRLARILLSLARVGVQGCRESKLPDISQETLAEIVGTSRPRVNIFMNRFKKLGLVEYGPEIKVKSSLKNILSPDCSSEPLPPAS
jgi:CRP/FNR family cyclic AMP-dependent transcriptional regulator